MPRIARGRTRKARRIGVRQLVGFPAVIDREMWTRGERKRLRRLEHATYEVFIAPFDLYLSEDTYLEPDIMVIPRPGAPIARFEGVPLLVVEVLSPSTRSSDTVTKRDAYAHAGIPHYWIVDPDAPGVMALALEGGAYVERGSASGSETLNVTEPFEVEVVPASLVD